MRLNTNTYSTIMRVRPDDLDLFRHVHSSRYIDYVLAARFDQMERCYNCGMQEFLSNGLGWVLVTTQLNFKRPLRMGDEFEVFTRISSLENKKVHVLFEIKIGSTGKVSCDGWAEYVLVSESTGKPADIPDWVIEKYSISDDEAHKSE